MIPTDNVAVVIAIGLVACAWDLRAQRIPNELTFGAAAAGLATLAATSGLAGAGTSIAGWLCGVALFFPFFAVRGMGGGDVKLLAAFGAWVGPAEVIQVALSAAIAGAVLALALAVARGYVRTLLENLRLMFATWAVVGPCAVPSLTLDTARGPRLAYAVPLTIGAVIALCA
jgi:prepilin peptidase CpaA